MHSSDQFAEILAPAKVNLFLEILARRDDGFHEIETLISSISLFDTLRFRPHSEEGPIRLTCRWGRGFAAQTSNCMAKTSPSHASTAVDSILGDLPEAKDNIVLRVLERLRVCAGVSRGATVQIVKRIPSAAGLGGASSDAAAALMAANHQWDLNWSGRELAELSAEFGSDIPFFFSGGAAICRGRGELVERFEQLPKMQLVVVKPPLGLSTPAVYRRCSVPSEPVPLRPLLDAARQADVPNLARRLSNRLQNAAEQLSPWIDKAREAFAGSSCLGHQMSGSGTSYFGIYRHARQARRAVGQLRAARIGTVFSASTLSMTSRP